MTILDGKQTAAQWRADITHRVHEIAPLYGGRTPKLAAVIVGDDPASVTYVNLKQKACAECGIRSTVKRLPADSTQQQVREAVRRLNANSDIDGIIVQQPLPPHIDSKDLLLHISPKKDVDGFTPDNIGRMALGLDCMPAATPAGIVELLRRNGITTRGKRVAVIGRSNIVGRPMASMLLEKSEMGDATVTVCNSSTPDLKEILAGCDIIISAAGCPGLVQADMVAEGAVVVDVGTTRVADPSRRSGYRLAGDVDFDAVAPKCSYITPVPGGVGPMTIASLLHNTLTAFVRRRRRTL
ncbi:MAG: bifunctional 5,10-methylenetetrahydrofolate dehydrogenase/5,10-methenyltetrahydrofolate cyclohydrolase [Muribaculaceae bacterium]|nr:bifunctional 5,10-methylenetetrahydrofolate dehydrogenase/5,10-methenyltetrahydrofolate cyclohydrolase [Muribaculaceae bacterium]